MIITFKMQHNDLDGFIAVLRNSTILLLFMSTFCNICPMYHIANLILFHYIVVASNFSLAKCLNKSSVMIYPYDASGGNGSASVTVQVELAGAMTLNILYRQINQSS